MDRDDDLPQADTDLVQLLVLEAGRIMEDGSAAFAEALPAFQPARAAKLASLLALGRTAHVVIEAAVQLEERCSTIALDADQRPETSV